MKPLKIIKGILILGLVAFGVYFTFGMEEEIQTTYYYLESDKITAPIRIALVSDTHSETFGEDNKELYERIQKEEVDLICMPGDILDDKKDPEKGYKSVKDFSTLAPTFYTTGNHEIRRKENKEIQNRMESMRIHRNQRTETFDWRNGRCLIGTRTFRASGNIERKTRELFFSPIVP